MNSAFKMTDFVLKMMDFVLKMMDFALKRLLGDEDYFACAGIGAGV